MGKKYTTVITGNIPPEYASRLDEISELIIWSEKTPFLMPRDHLIKILPDSDAIVNFGELKVDEDLLGFAPKLKVVANVSIGFDNLSLDALSRRGIWASNSPGFFSYPVAEYIFAGMLMLARNLGSADRFVRNGDWKGFEPGRWDGRSLREMTLGIIGFGAIGRELAAIARAIGMEVKYYSHSNKSEIGYTELDQLLCQSDFVSINVPLNGNTRKMVGQGFIDRMKDGSVIINTSRGGVMDQDAVTRSLRSGKLGGAILDVFENEPEVPSCLKEMENVLLTPHMAGGTRTSRRTCVENALLNVYDVLAGNPPRNAINEKSAVAK